MNLETLKEVKLHFDFHSDSSTHCLGYSWLCRKIEELEQLSIPAVMQAKPEKVCRDNKNPHIHNSLTEWRDVYFDD